MFGKLPAPLYPLPQAFALRQARRYVCHTLCSCVLTLLIITACASAKNVMYIFIYFLGFLGKYSLDKNGNQVSQPAKCIKRPELLAFGYL